VLDAITALNDIDTAGDPELAAEAAYLTGSAYFQLGDYANAARLLAEARRSFVLGASDGRVLAFELGASWFLLGRPRDAIPLLEELAGSQVKDNYAPYAWLLLAKARVDAGDASGAKAAAEQGLRLYAGTEFEREFSDLLEKP
jgi:predicted negative regulator of RcsB-dependent stress response